MLVNLNVFGMFPSTESVDRRFAFLHRVLQGKFPCFISTIKALRRPAAIPPHFVSFAWRYLGCTRCFAPQRTSEPLGPGVGNPVSPAGSSPRSEQGSPKFLGNHDCPFAHVPIRRRQDCLHQTITVAAAWPLVIEGQKLPRKVFRRSIAWLSDSLSTLRRTGYPHTTQDSLPAAGQALPDGLSTRKTPAKGVKAANPSHPPFPSFLAQSHRPSEQWLRRRMPHLSSD